MKFTVLSLSALLRVAAGRCGVECPDLANIQGLQLPEGVKITAIPIAAYSLSIPEWPMNLTGNKFALCRVQGGFSYGERREATLNFEVWLPEKSRYNGRYVSVGKIALDTRQDWI